MSNRNRTPRTAALLLSIAVGGATLTILPAAHAVVDPTAPVVKRLSAAKGVAGDKIFVQGANLATLDDNGTPADTSDDTWQAGTVVFDSLVEGGTDATASSVTALSATALVVTVPAHANGATQVLVGSATKGPKFAYSAPITVTTLQAALTALAPKSETGLADVTIAGTNFTKSTKVLIGGKAAKLATDGLAADGTSIKVALPAGLWGIQDVVVTDPSATIYVGYVTYAGLKPTIGTVTGTAYAEQASVVEITGGTNLDLVTGVTYDGATAAFKVTKGDGTKLTVTIPAGAANASGALVVTTKYGETASKTVARVAAPVPTVSAVSTVTAVTPGEVTLTGTNLTGLKKVVVKDANGKTYSGSKITVVSATSAKVTLPALQPGDYTLSVTAISATASTDKTFTVATPAPGVTTVTVSADKKTVTITGTWLAGATKVDFTPGTGSVVSATTGLTATGTTKLVVVLGSALTAETWDVLVTTPAGTSGTTGDNKLVVS